MRTTLRSPGPWILLTAALLAGTWPAAAGEMPDAYRCSGNEPFWSLVIEDEAATYTAMGEEPRELDGKTASLDSAGLFAFRGSEGDTADWVVVILALACQDTMADEAEGGGTSPYTVALSTPSGEARSGCCRPLETATEPGDGDQPSPLAGIEGIDWHLDSFGGDQALPGGVSITIGFDDGTVAGSAGCNRYSGSYSATRDGALSFGPLAMTRMACPPPAGELESRYVDALEAVERFRIDGSALVLDDGADESDSALRFSREPDTAE